MSLSPFCAAETRASNRGEGEHRPSSAAECGSCALPGRDAQPPDLAFEARESAGGRSGAGFFPPTLAMAALRA